MQGLLLALLLFSFWTCVGYALVSALRLLPYALQRVLAAPTVGMATTILVGFALNRLGLPVERFGVALTGALGVSAVGYLAWRRPCLPLRQALLFGVPLLVALISTGWPMLKLGFEWMSVANDDMANVAVASYRLLHHGSLQSPDISQVLAGLDYSGFYWFFELNTPRPGSALLLAWASSLTGLTGQEVFMSVILAAQMALTAAAGGLVCQTPAYRNPALLTCGLLSVSAMTALGTIYQLLPQVSGIGLLLACLIVALRPWDSDVDRRWIMKTGLLFGALGTALLLAYIEVGVFLGSAIVVYYAVRLVRRQLDPRPLLGSMGVAVLTLVLILNTYLVYVAGFFAQELHAGLTESNELSHLFPWFLVPSGMAALWGLQPVNSLSAEPWLSASIALGAVMLIATSVAAIILTWRGQPVAAACLAMIAFAVRTWDQQFDYGLFKLAMFAQPLLLGTLALTPFLRRSWLPQSVVPVLLFGLVGMVGQQANVRVGLSGAQSPVNADNQPVYMNADFSRIEQAARTGHAVVDMATMPIAKFESVLLEGIPSTFISRDFFSGLSELGTLGVDDHARAMKTELDSQKQKVAFDMHAGGDESAPQSDEFIISHLGDSGSEGTACDTVIMTPTRQGVLNRWHLAQQDGWTFGAVPCSSLSNYLVFTNSMLGQHYYLGDWNHAAIFQAEPDPVMPGSQMAGVGRYLLFQVIQPTEQVRLELNFSATLIKGQRATRLPPVVGIGAQRTPFDIVGRGSARVFSPPITPQVINGRSFVALDLGIEPGRFPDYRTGLMNLYGSGISLDPRLLDGFARDISAISEPRYEQRSVPGEITSFPADLANPDLEYSGIYEDGWVAESSYFMLLQPPTPATVVVSGNVPVINGNRQNVVLQTIVDGQEIDERMLRPGQFEVRVPAPAGQGTRRLELHFSDVQVLPAGDERSVAAQLDTVGFEPQP